MKLSLSLDGSLSEVIDLKLYLDTPSRQRILELYRLRHWDFWPEDAWIWRFEDVCALYFRARRHSGVFASEPEAAAVLYAIERAVKDSMEDEFA
jgi:hypothetical protein